MLDLTEAINSIISVNHMEEDVVLNLVKDMLTSAYKRKFGTDENVSIKFFPDETGKMRKVEVYSVKEVVEEENWYDAVKQIPLDDARELAEDVDVGDYLEIPIDPSTFEYSAVQSAKQRSTSSLKSPIAAAPLWLDRLDKQDDQRRVNSFASLIDMVGFCLN